MCRLGKSLQKRSVVLTGVNSVGKPVAFCTSLRGKTGEIGSSAVVLDLAFSFDLSSSFQKAWAEISCPFRCEWTLVGKLAESSDKSERG